MTAAWWARWRLKSPASQLFTEPFVQVHIKENQSSASLAFVRGIHRWPMISPHKRPVTPKTYPFDDVMMMMCYTSYHSLTITACDMADQYPTSYKFVAVPYSPDWCISLKCKGIWHAAVYYSESFPGKILIQSTLSILRSITWYFMGHKYVICGVGNFHRPANPRPTTLEEDRELFLLIFLQFYVYGLRFKAWGPTTFFTEFQTLLICRK